MKKLFLTLLLLSFTGCGPRDNHRIHVTSDSVSTPKPKRPFGYHEWHLILYQNGNIVKDYDTISELYNSSEDYSTFTYRNKNYKFHMDYIAELME
jgi:hypothetical protein